MTEATESVEAVHFSFLTDEETKKHSFVKITNPILLDSLERPVPGGLYDPALGPLDDRTICRTCGQRSFHCPGHCGHIDLVSPIYNPLLFDILFNILQRTCSYCHHFKAGRGQVGKCVSQLENIIKGDIVEAKRLDFSIGKYSDPEDSDGSYESCSMAPSSREYHNTRSGKSRWTSLQLAEAMSVLGNFLKCKYKKCKNCDAESPKISKPTFGWFHMNGLSDAQIRANIIRGSKLEGRPTGIVEEQPSSGVEDADDACQNDDSVDESDIFLSTANSHRNKEGKTKRAVRKGEKMLAEYSKQKTFFSGPLLPSEVEDIMRHLWENEAQLCSYISNIQGDRFDRKENRGYTMFFLGAILVPPLKFRPPSKGGESVMEHPQTVLLGKVLQCNISLGNAHVNNLDRSKLVNRWIELQQSVNVLFDSKTGTAQNQREIASGICQLLEKKEGIFRQKMMGKRVNYACRSVISPDPYLAVNEIGIPPYFALRLTYPERVTPWNVAKLRNAVINGPDVHPGATHYADKLSTVKLPSNNRKTRITYSRKLPSSRGVVTQTGKNSDYEFEGKQVYRHLEDGDIVLVNRQPTLHKPSIMAHVVRVLKGEKTLRMHYANCSTYNADFDGDEMNVHFPQDEISRAEAYNIVNANNQYTVPTRGDPIRGLIQDHIVSSVLLTKKDTFLDRDQFNQLLYSSGISSSQKGSFTCKPGKKVVLMDYEDEMSLLAPAILKPKVLWTGKQVITAVLNHITKGKLPFTVEKEGKISGKYFASKRRDGKSSKRRKSDVDEANGKKEPPGEETLLIYKNVLVRGVIDKGQFGNFGLVHIVQELYGSNAAGTLLSAFSRLFTVFLQMHGFTCGVDDLLLLEQFDKERKQRLEKCDDIGFDVHSEFVGCRTNKNIGPKELQMRIENVIRRRGESAITWLDGRIRGKLNAEVSEINKDLFLIGLWKSFPKNCFSLMTATGAKGSMVNFQQVSSLLGQQDLEGKRVPRMVSGKTLPCFIPWDWTSRAGGFICDNFLSGLRPQEYYFHCMAGREGLVDTAVKTSRSGYLQRCLIKNLESLKVCYDHTVRDADGSVVQFLYGEDGVDVHQTGFLAKLNLLEENYDILEGSFYQQSGKSNSYIDRLPEKLLMKGKEKMQNRSNLGLSKLQSGSDAFLKLMEYKYFSSLAQPGEPVGVIAAQSVGEPSTQMTLNTFHLAGRGDMNVTLGIPRLQEILMTASSDIKTPIMTCPLQIERSKSDADRLATKLMNVTLADIIESIGVSVVPFAVSDKQVSSVYKLTIKLYDPQHHLPESGILLEDCGYILEVVYLRELEDAIHNHLVLVSRISGIRSFTPDSLPRASNETDGNAPAQKGEENGDDGGDGIDVDDGAEDFGSDAQKRKRQATDEMDYEDGLEDEPHSEVEVEKEVEHSEVVNGNGGDGEDGGGDGEDGGGDETFARSSNPEASSKPGTAGKTKKTRAALSKKKTDRSFSVKVEGALLEVQFKFTNEPHVLLTQIAQKAAGKVYLKRSGKIDQCMSVDCGHRQVIYYGEDPKARNEVKDEEKQKIPALQAAGLDFTAFWKMQDDLDIRYVYTNNIHAMLNTYGVEAAREAIIREVQHVFNSYGISVDVRHLSLIADFMTHSGGYQPMSRTGGIAESISPLSKMSFETASKFIVQAAFHGLTDNLESPSARICLGLPVKGGTGCFDLLQEITSLT